MENQSFQISPIGTLRTCFTEKFGVPRQSMMVPEAKGFLKLNPDPRFRDALRGLEQFSHVWILFLFHEHLDQDWRPLTTPPRTDAPPRVGVFASRSPFRPNGIGMSAVKLEKINYDSPGGIEVEFSGVDLLDGTLVLDLKPYVPYVDSIPLADPAWAGTELPKYEVQFSEDSLQQIFEVTPGIQKSHGVDFKILIEQMLQWDTRPMSQRSSDSRQEFAFRILGFDVQWQMRDATIFVQRLTRLV